MKTAITVFTFCLVIMAIIGSSDAVAKKRHRPTSVQWRELTLIIPTVDIDGCKDTMNAAYLTEAKAEANRLDNDIVSATRGMIAVKNDVVVSTVPLTSRSLTDWMTGPLATSHHVDFTNDLMPLLTKLGIDNNAYDTVVTIVANKCIDSFASGGGLTGLFRKDCKTCKGHPGGSSVVYMADEGPTIDDNVMTHEWMHQVTWFFHHYLKRDPYLTIDEPEKYCDATTHRSYQPYDTLDIKLKIRDDILGGNIEACANPGVQIGFDAATWKMGTPLDWRRSRGA